MSKRRSSIAAIPARPTFDLVAVATEHRDVLVSDIGASPLNPRTRKTPLDDGFLASIARHGVIEPIVLRRVDDPVIFGAQYEVVAGERRLRACRQVGRTEIPASIRAVTDEELLELALAENLHRQSMHPLDEAAALAKLQTLDRVYQDLDALASKIGRSASYVRDRLKLLRLDPLVVEALDADAITTKHAELIATLPVDQHALALAACFLPSLDISNPTTLLAAKAWGKLAPGLGSTRDLADWTKRHGKADLTAPEAQPALQAFLDEQLTDTTDSESAVAAAVKALLQLSTDRYLTKEIRREVGVIGADDWKAVKKPGACAFARKGALVHGEAFRDGGSVITVVDVCVQKRHCAKHWPTPKAPSPAMARANEQAHALQRQRQENTEAARKDWETKQAAYCRALGALASKRRHSFVEVVRDRLGPGLVRRAAKLFGVVLTEQTAALVLVFAQINTYTPDGFFMEAKSLGVTKKQLDAAVATAAPKKGKG